MDKKDGELLSVHSNRMVKVGQTDELPIFWCTICSIKLSTPSIARQHFKGHSHKVKLKLLSESKINKKIEVINSGNLTKATKRFAPVDGNDWYNAKTIRTAGGNNVPVRKGLNSKPAGKKTFTVNKSFKGEKKTLSETKLSTTKWKRDLSSTRKSYPSHKDFNEPKKSNDAMQSGKILDKNLSPVTPTKKFLFQGELREAVNWVKASTTEEEEPFKAIYKEPVELIDRYQTFSVLSARRNYLEKQNGNSKNFTEYACNNSIPYEDSYQTHQEENENRNFDSYERYDEYGNDISIPHENSYQTYSREEQNGHFPSNDMHEKYAHNPYGDSYQTHPIEKQNRNFDSNHTYNDYGNNISNSYEDSYQTRPGEKQNGHYDSNNTQKEYHPSKYSNGTYTITPYGYTWVPS